MTDREATLAIYVVVLVSLVIACSLLATHALGRLVPEVDETDRPLLAHAAAVLASGVRP